MLWQLALALVLGLSLTIVVVGAMLPRDHVASTSLRIPASPAAVWAKVTAPEGFPSWRKELTRVQVTEGTPRKWTEVSRFGLVPYVVEEELDEKRLVTRIANDALPWGGTWTWELSPDGDGTTVTLTEKGFVKPPHFRFLSRFVFGYDTNMKRVLASLAASFSAPA